MLTVGAAVKDVYPTWRQFMGMPEKADHVARSLREFGRIPADESWVYACMALRASAAQGVPLSVEVRDGAEWVPLEGRSDAAGEDLQFLVQDVNPAWHGATLGAYMEAGAAIHGGSYLRKVRGRLGGPPQELWWLSGAELEPVMGRTYPEAYEHRNPQTTGETYQARGTRAPPPARHPAK